MEITSELIKKLRDKTGAGMMDCKRALEASKGDMDAAIEYLRKKGAAVAQKRADRSAKEGMIVTHVSADGKLGVVAAAQLHRVAHGEHAHHVAVLFLEDHHRAALLGVLDTHDLRLHLVVREDALVDDVLHAPCLLRAERLAVGEVEAEAVRPDQRALLLRVLPEHFAQRQVRFVAEWFLRIASRRGTSIKSSASCPTESDPSRTIPRWTDKPWIGFWVSSTSRAPEALLIVPMSPTWPPDSA